MLDYVMMKYLNFVWGRVKWFRKTMIMVNYKFFRYGDNCTVNFYYQQQDLRMFLTSFSSDEFRSKRKIRMVVRKRHLKLRRLSWYKFFVYKKQQQSRIKLYPTYSWTITKFRDLILISNLSIFSKTFTFSWK